jgi:hypothetical protein
MLCSIPCSNYGGHYNLIQLHCLVIFFLFLNAMQGKKTIVAENDSHDLIFL